jgi:hypothetical protein
MDRAQPCQLCFRVGNSQEGRAVNSGPATAHHDHEASTVFYLAEVVQKGKTFLGKGKIVLQLLACQQRDGWRSLANEEQIALEGYEYNPGVLLLVELAPTRDHALRLEEAQRTLVGLLQDHSRLQEQIKTKESEVEQWRESLRIQSEEVSHRQAELEFQQGELSNLQAELDELARQHYDVRLLRDELDQVRRELNQRNQDLSSVWDQLNAGVSGEGLRGLSPAQLEEIGITLDTLLGHDGPGSGDLSVLDQLITLNTQQQTCLDRCRDQLQRLAEGEAIPLEGSEALGRNFQVVSIQHQLTLLEQQGLAHQTLRLQLQQLIRSDADDFDPATVELLPLEQLEERVQSLENESTRIMTFVNDQEEELRPQREAIEQLKSRLATADEFARLTLEGELNDAEDRYRMLDHSLVEQRRTAQQRRQMYLRHRQILDRRRGVPTPDDLGLQVDLTPVLRLLDEQEKAQQTQYQSLQQQLEQIQADLSHQTPRAIENQPSLLVQLLEESRNLQCLMGETADLFTELNRQHELRQQLCQRLKDGLSQYLQTAVTAA